MSSLFFLKFFIDIRAILILHFLQQLCDFLHADWMIATLYGIWEYNFIKFYGSLNLQVHVNDDSAICFCLSLVPDFWGNFTAQGMDFFFLNCQCYNEKQIDNNDIVFMVYTLKDLRNTIKLYVQDFSVNQSPRARVFWPHDHEIF